MTTKKASAEATPKKKPVKPKLTAAERRAQREAEQQAAEARRLAAAAEFEQQRPLVWQGVWVKVLRLYLISMRDEEFAAEYSWWFDDLVVDAWQQAFQVHTLGGQFGGLVSESKLYAADVSRLHEDLDGALGWYEAFLAEKERKHQEELEQERRRDAAMAKLTAEDKQALGLQ